ncbi:MAG: sigma-70 family RNA polymerase sigma factor [Ilumatobacteraceae bacterium]
MTDVSTEHPRAAELRTFVDREYRQVVGSVTMITGDRTIAEDAVQEALVKAWKRREQPIENLAAWVTVVASNEARSGRRRKGSEQRALERAARRTDASGMAGDHDADGVDPELFAALAGLPLRERQTAVLFYVHDLSVLDVAAQLGISEGSVKTLLSRARSHLATALGHEATGGVA